MTAIIVIAIIIIWLSLGALGAYLDAKSNSIEYTRSELMGSALFGLIFFLYSLVDKSDSDFWNKKVF